MQKPLLVLIDTNIFIYKTKLLKTPLATSLLYLLKTQNGFLAIPEILEYELNKHFRKNVIKAMDQIRNSYNEIEILMGVRDDYKLPNDQNIEERVSKRLAELNQFIIRHPFTIDNAKAALKRVIDEIPPNGPKNQQFKDSVLWENLLELSNDYNAHFITQDTGYFENCKPENGLSSVLKPEIQDKAIRVYFELTDFLDTFRVATPGIDYEKLAELIYHSLEEPFKEFCIEKGYVVGSMEKCSITPYLTEDPQKIAIDYELVFNVLTQRPDNPDAEEILAFVRGDTNFLINKFQLDEIPLLGIEFYNHDGQQLPGGLITARANLSLFGREKIHHKFKFPFPFGKSSKPFSKEQNSGYKEKK